MADYVRVRASQPGDGDDGGVLLLLVLCVFVLLFCGSAYLLGRVRYVHPRFSVQVQGLEGLDDPSVSAPAFNLTIHVDNKQHMRRVCWENTAVVMYYNETSVVGWCSLPAFCVDRWSAVDLDVSSLPRDGVFLSRMLRDKMMRDRQARGSIELNVEIKPIDPKDGSTACFQVCDTMLGEGVSASQCIPFCGLDSAKRYF